MAGFRLTVEIKAGLDLSLISPFFSKTNAVHRNCPLDQKPRFSIVPFNFHAQQDI